jgi:Domain of unknown function (DUF4123)
MSRKSAHAVAGDARVNLLDSVGDMRESLYRLFREYGRTYLLIDRFDGDLPFEELDTSAVPAPELYPLRDPIFADAPGRSPALLALDQGHASHLELLDMSVVAALRQVSSIDVPRSICAWLFCHAEPAILALNLSRRLTARFADGKSVYLRYFDPRVTPRLAQLLGAHAADRLFAPVQVWCQLGRDGGFVRHDSRPTLNALASVELHLDKPTSLAVQRIERINLVASTLARGGMVLGHERDSDIDAALVAAATLGVERTEDQISYATWAIRDGAEFTQHAAVGACIERAQRTAVPLEDLLTDSLWPATPRRSNEADDRLNPKTANQQATP